MSRYLQVGAVVLAVSLSGCGVKQNLAGIWKCKTANPDQSSSMEQFTFQPDGSFSLVSGDQPMLGRYEIKGQQVAMVVTQIPGLAAYGVSTAANKPITADIKSISATRLVMETYTTSSALRRTSVCSH